jgi:hypothetical protein
MFSVEFTIGRRSLPPKAESEETSRSEFCCDAELRFPLSAACSGAKPTCKEAGQDHNAQIRQPLFSRLLSGRWCRG